MYRDYTNERRTADILQAARTPASTSAWIVQSNCGPHTWKAESAEDAKQLHLLWAELSGAPGGETLIHNVVRANVEHQDRGDAKRLPKAVRERLVDATKKANLERAGFAQDETVRVEDVKRYLDTWVTHTLREILRYDNGEVDAWRLEDRNW